jgi:hypothetical protein
MKKIVLSLMIVILSVLLFAVEEQSPFDSFMGMKWGTNATEFKKTFQYKIIPMVTTHYNVFVLNNLQLGTMNIKRIFFCFKKTGDNKDLEFKEKNYNQFYFYGVEMSTTPDQFDGLLDVFTKKYGKPLTLKNSKILNRMGVEFLQSIAYWENGDRTISLYRYGSQIDRGNATFTSKEEINKTIDKEKKENEKAADIL